MGVEAQSFSGYAPMPTNGSYFTLLFSHHNQAHLVGDTARLTQNVELTGLSKVTFDAKLNPPAGSTWVNAVRGEVRIDGQSVWSRTAQGDYLNQSIDVSSLSGVHEIELRNEVVVAGTYNSQWVVFDNFRTYDIAGTYVGAGALISPAISPAARQRWGTLSFTKDTSAAATALTVDVVDMNGAALATNVASGTDLNGIPAVASQSSIRLRANLSTTNSSNTPRLDDWSVEYFTALQQTFLSA